MSDTATAEMPPEIKEELEKIATTTKRGFDVQARVKGRGLRKARITLYLDEEKGVELGWAHDVTDALGNITSRQREGVIGKLDAAQEELAAAIKKHEALAAAGEVLGVKEKETMQSIVEMGEGRIAELEAQRDELIAELTKTAIVVRMCAVPPKIQKDCRRKAKMTLGITDKNVPDDLVEEFNIAETAHLMSLMFQSITDNETGSVNTETTYEDAIALMEYLPPGQFVRLDMMMGKVQFTDAISRSIEGQEDFS